MIYLVHNSLLYPSSKLFLYQFPDQNSRWTRVWTVFNDGDIYEWKTKHSVPTYYDTIKMQATNEFIAEDIQTALYHLFYFFL